MEMPFRPFGAFVCRYPTFRGLYPLLYPCGLPGLKQDASVPCIAPKGRRNIVRPEGQTEYSQG